MEVSATPKVVLDNLLANRGSAATFKDAASFSKQSNGYRQLPVPLFHGSSLRVNAMGAPSESPTVSLPPLAGGSHMRNLVTSAPNLFKDCADPFVKEGSVLPPVKEKPKRIRKSRAGASSRKNGMSEALLDTNVEGDQGLHVPPPKRRRPSAKSSGDAVCAEIGEKPPPRKRNRSKAKAKEEKLSLSTNDTSFGSIPMSCKGVSGIHGLEMKSLDLSRYMKDISVENLIAGDFNVPFVCGKQGPPSSSIIDNSFGLNVSSILRNLTRPVNSDEARPVSLYSKPMESKPLKLSFDLESSPFDESEECVGVDLLEPKAKASQKESSTPFLQSRKAHDAPSLFSPETISAVIPPADFWNSLQIQPTASLSSLSAQASTATDSRYFPLEGGFNYDKFSTLPPPIFSLGSSQMPQESLGEKLASSKLNQWFRAEPPKWDLPETQPHHSATFSKGSNFPFKLDTESNPLTKPSEKCRLKEGLLDIDLNKQSPEAEAAESIHSASVVLTGPQARTEVPVHLQPTTSRCDIDKDSQSVKIGVSVNASTPLDEVKATCIIDTMLDCCDLDCTSEMCLPSQEISKTAEKTMEESVVAIPDKPQTLIEQPEDVLNASSGRQTLMVPDAPESEDICSSDVPYSPGMLATALLLCEMANSSSPFYIERDDEHTQASKLETEDYPGRPSKSSKVIGLTEKGKVLGLTESEVSMHKRADLHTSWNEEYTAKMQAKDKKDKSVFTVKGSSNGPTSEPWASTPPRHAPKNVVSRMSGSQSSESDRSPGYGSRDQRSHGVFGNIKKPQREKQYGVAASCKVASLCTRKDLKGNPRPVSKTSFLNTLPTKGPSVSSQKRKLPVEANQSSAVYGDGLTKVSRPRSNTSKNCIQSQRGYPVQIGCSIKSANSRHVLPLVGEVRHGSK